MNKKSRFSINAIIDWSLVLLWIGIFVIAVILPAFEEEREQPIMAMGALKIFNSTRFIEWERSEVIAFSFEQLNTAINYVFIAASALLGIVLKALVEPLLQDQKTTLDGRIKILMLHCSYGCLLSIALGFYGKTFLNDLLLKESFSFYDSPLGMAISFQIIAFLIAALLLIFSAKRLIKLQSS